MPHRLYRLYRKHSNYHLLFENALAGDEIYFVSIFEMTKQSNQVENENNLRFIDWTKQTNAYYAGSPNICTMSMVSTIEKSNAFFARKFDSKTDKDVINYFLSNTLIDQ